VNFPPQVFARELAMGKKKFDSLKIVNEMAENTEFARERYRFLSPSS
jgi:hypothetical protein